MVELEFQNMWHDDVVIPEGTKSYQELSLYVDMNQIVTNPVIQSFIHQHQIIKKLSSLLILLSTAVIAPIYDAPCTTHYGSGVEKLMRLDLSPS